MNQAIINPPYYNHPSGLKCHEVSGLLMGWPCQAVQYVWRYQGKGNPIQDLEKAETCLSFIPRVFYQLCWWGDIDTLREHAVLLSTTDTDSWRGECLKQLIFMATDECLDCREKAEKMIRDRIVELSLEQHHV